MVTLTEQFDRVWEEIVKVYPAYQLSHETDRLIATSGLAQRFLKAYEAVGCSTRYLAGVWIHYLLVGLVWFL